MSALELIELNLLTPAILAFFLGVIATLVRSDLKFPDEIYQGLSIYLLFAIGLKGGVAIAASGIGEILLPLSAGIAASAMTPLWCYAVLRLGGKLSVPDAAAVAAHYGSVSVVTFLASLSFLKAANVSAEGYLPALVAVMEVPAIVVALLLARSKVQEDVPWTSALREILAGKSIFLLLGGLAVGIAVGERGFEKVEGFFVVPFQGILCLFLLEMGMVAARRFGDLRRVGLFLVAFGLVMPVLHACGGIFLGKLCGMSQGGAFVFGVLAASASYIAAPAAIRVSLPQANPAYYLASSLALTFPFNLALGIPLYFAISGWIFRS